MLRLALLFLLIALVAGAFNFSGIEAASLGVAQVLFFVFLALCVVFAVLGLVRGVDKAV
jgi:uncharacterized membrane protein YtjA (UPF0391 family)